MSLKYLVNHASQVALVVKNPPVNAGDIRDMGSIPGSGRSPGAGMTTHSSIPAWRIPWTEEAWQVTVHCVAQSWTRPKQQHVVNRCAIIYTVVLCIEWRQSRVNTLLKGPGMFTVVSEHRLQLKPCWGPLIDRNLVVRSRR